MSQDRTLNLKCFDHFLILHKTKWMSLILSTLHKLSLHERSVLSYVIESYVICDILSPFETATNCTQGVQIITYQVLWFQVSVAWKTNCF